MVSTPEMSKFEGGMGLIWSSVFLYWLCFQFTVDHFFTFLSCFFRSKKIDAFRLFLAQAPQWTGSIASTKKLSPIWDPVHLQTYSFLVWKPLKNKYFIFVLFRNWPISTFPYVKLKEKWRKNGRLCAENCLNLFKNDLNSLLNKHW